MTTDEIIEMAIQAGFDEHHAKLDTRIEAFANLIAAHEREACEKVCDELAKANDLHDGAYACLEAIRQREQA